MQRRNRILSWRGNSSPQRGGRGFICPLWVMCAIVLCAVSPALAGEERRLTPDEAQVYRKENPELFIVDLRTAREYAVGHLSGAVNIPAFELEARLDEIPKGRPVMLYCGLGARSVLCGRILLERRPDLPEVCFIGGRPIFDEE